MARVVEVAPPEALPDAQSTILIIEDDAVLRARLTVAPRFPREFLC